MMILIKDTLVKDTKSKHHNQKVDVLIEDGLIKQIGSEISSKDTQVIDAKGTVLSTGFLDVGTTLNEPGYEHKETLANLCQSAQAGGYTHLGVFSNTKPIIQHRQQVAALKKASNAVNIIPIPALTEDNKGTHLAEMLDMSEEGVNVFSDGKYSVWHPGIMMKSLQYLQKIDGLVIQKPFDKYLSKDGQMHEAYQSTITGLKGIPSISETITIQRDIELLRYTGGKLHFHTISTKESVRIIADAKKEGLEVTCDVSVFHLAYTDEAIADFDTNFKLNPPLREEEDKQVLIAGVLDGTIDYIVSMHQAQEEEAKKLEFNYADEGAISLETVFSLLIDVFGNKTEEILSKLKAYQMLGLEMPIIEEGATANLVVLDFDKKWKYTKSLSRSSNSPLLGKGLKGKVLYTILNDNVYEVL